MNSLYKSKIDELNYNDEIKENEFTDNDSNIEYSRRKLKIRNQIMHLFPNSDW